MKKKELFPHTVGRAESRQQLLQGEQQHDHEHHGTLGDHGGQGIPPQHREDTAPAEHLFQFKADACHGRSTSRLRFCTACR